MCCAERDDARGCDVRAPPPFYFGKKCARMFHTLYSGGTATWYGTSRAPPSRRIRNRFTWCLGKPAQLSHTCFSYSLPCSRTTFRPFPRPPLSPVPELSHPIPPFHTVPVPQPRLSPLLTLYKPLSPPCLHPPPHPAHHFPIFTRSSPAPSPPQTNSRCCEPRSSSSAVSPARTGTR